MKDITKYRQIEKRLQESEQKYRYLMKCVPMTIAISTPKGEIFDVNPVAVKMYGYSKEEFKKLTASELYYDPKDRETFVEKLQKNGRVVDFEVRFKRKDGSVFWGSISSTVQKIDETTQFLIVVMDISERKKMEESLKDEMHRMQILLDAAMGREEKMIALKDKIRELEEKLKKGGVHAE